MTKRSVSALCAVEEDEEGGEKETDPFVDLAFDEEKVKAYRKLFTRLPKMPSGVLSGATSW